MSVFTQKFTEHVKKHLKNVDIEIDAVAPKFEILYRELADANERMNLTAIRDEDGVIVRHFIDCMSILPYVESAGRAVDVGCGGGFPTLPLAICRPNIEITALDSTAKKLSFVENVAKKLSLNVKTLAARAEEYGAGEGREIYPLVTSRAVAELRVLCELCLPLTAVGGRFVAMKGADGMAELDVASGAIKKLGGKLVCADRFTLGDAGERVIIVIEKMSHTPAAYPRRYAKIKAAPL